MEEEPAQSHLGVEAFLALSTLGLCHRAACVSPEGPGTKAAALGAATTLPSDTDSRFFLRTRCPLCSALVLRMVFSSHSRLKGGY